MILMNTFHSYFSLAILKMNTLLAGFSLISLADNFVRALLKPTKEEETMRLMKTLLILFALLLSLPGSAASLARKQRLTTPINR